LYYPKFYELKKATGGNVIKFSGVNNSSSGMNLKSKTAREGGNKRNRLYTLGWERAMRKRIPDLELAQGEHGTIYIRYKSSAGESSPEQSTEE